MRVLKKGSGLPVAELLQRVRDEKLGRTSQNVIVKSKEDGNVNFEMAGK